MMKKLILASGSPRRSEILAKLRLPFEVEASDYEEDMSLAMPPAALAEFLSAGKAQAVAQKNTDAIVIGADTFVVFGNHRIGKPKTPERAKEMLELLSGKEHEIITGVTIIDSDTNKSSSFHESVKIFMAKLSPETIDAYIQTGEPLDKAGAYAVQEMGALLIEKMEGDFFVATGLPLRRLAIELQKFEINVLSLSLKPMRERALSASLQLPL